MLRSMVARRKTTGRRTRLRLDVLEDRALMDAGFRAIDGTGNNLANPDWGSTGVDLLRNAPAAYADGSPPRPGPTGPAPASISNAIVAHARQDIISDRQMSAMIYAWGQFLDHDLDLTQPPTPRRAVQRRRPGRRPVLRPDQHRHPGHPRSTARVYDPATGTGTDNPRQQVNPITAWIDGSMVYGSDAHRRRPAHASPAASSRPTRRQPACRRDAGRRTSWPATCGPTRTSS